MEPSQKPRSKATRSKTTRSNTTMKHVAARAGVGLGTVSRVLNNDPEVSASTRQRVLRAAEELGYTRSTVARSLKTGATGNVGVAIMSRHAPVILNPFYAEVIGGIEEVLEQHDRHLLLSSLRRHGHLVDLAREGRVDALIVVGCDIADEDLALLAHSDRPVVLVDHHYPGLPSVTVDHLSAGRLAAEHLLERGSRRPAFVAENLDNPNFLLRLKGFREVLQERGVELLATEIAAGGDSWDGGFHAMNRVLETGARPDGVFAANDPAALSALRALRQAGLRVPEDVKVIGCDDIYLAAQAQPPLTTLHIEKRQLGRLGAEQAMGLLDGAGNGGATVLSPTLKVRGST